MKDKAPLFLSTDHSERAIDPRQLFVLEFAGNTKFVATQVVHRRQGKMTTALHETCTHAYGSGFGVLYKAFYAYGPGVFHIGVY